MTPQNPEPLATGAGSWNPSRRSMRRSYRVPTTWPEPVGVSTAGW